MTPRAVVSRQRELFVTTHSDLRATWHPEADTLVLTLWSTDGRCTGSAPLTAAEAGRLLAFVARCLALRATMPATAPPPLRETGRQFAHALRRRADRLRRRLR